MMLGLLICVVIVASAHANVDGKIAQIEFDSDLTKDGGYLIQKVELIGNEFLGIIDSAIANARTGRDVFEGRKKKKKKKLKKLKKYLLPVLIGILLIKSILLPLVLKTLAILSGKAVMISVMSLILAAIIGLRNIASGALRKVDSTENSKYRRRYQEDKLERDPYGYYDEYRERWKK